MNYNRKVFRSDRVMYYLNDLRHRLDGPAIEWVDGFKEWFNHNKRHRADGPAVEGFVGYKEFQYKEYWINDKEYSEQSFNEYIQSLKIPEYFNEL